MTYLISFGSLVLAGVFVGLPLFLIFLWSGDKILNLVSFGRLGRFTLIVLKSLRRNFLRTSLTYLATFVFVAVVLLVWSVLYFLDSVMTEQTKDVKIIVSEKWEAFSQMPFSYATPLADGARNPARSSDLRPQDSMTWQYFMGQMGSERTFDEKKSRDEQMFVIALEPSKLLTMMEEVFSDLRPVHEEQPKKPSQEVIERFKQSVDRLEHTKPGIIIGVEKLKLMNKKVGDRFHVRSSNYSGIELEFEVVGEFPQGKYDMFAVMRRDYLNDSIDAYPRAHNGERHALADKSLNVVWLKVPDKAAYNKVAEQIDTSSIFQSPAVKCETLAAAIATQMESWKDFVFGLRWLLSPAILATMCIVLCNSISISVRERRGELAVMKVLGYRPSHLLFLVLGEAVLVGTAAGAISAGLVYAAVNAASAYGDPGPFMLPLQALWWGPAMGASTAIVGCMVPAWGACQVKVAQVFSKVA